MFDRLDFGIALTGYSLKYLEAFKYISVESMVMVAVITDKPWK